MKRHLCILIITLFTAFYSAESTAGKKDKIKKIKVVTNTYFEGCPYSSDVGLSIKYKLKSKAKNDIEVFGSNDSVGYFLISSLEVEKGNGTAILTFDAGECLKEIKVNFKS